MYHFTSLHLTIGFDAAHNYRGVQWGWTGPNSQRGAAGSLTSFRCVAAFCTFSKMAFCCNLAFTTTLTKIAAVPFVLTIPMHRFEIESRHGAKTMHEGFLLHQNAEQSAFGVRPLPAVEAPFVPAALQLD